MSLPGAGWDSRPETFACASCLALASGFAHEHCYEQVAQVEDSTRGSRIVSPNGPNIGQRVVAEACNHDVRVSEVSVLLFGSAGRLEIGKRMGLPDVLTGYGAVKRRPGDDKLVDRAYVRETRRTQQSVRSRVWCGLSAPKK
jgi:hypothetical protein